MYKSPIELVYGSCQTQLEGEVMRAIQNVGVNVDKEELLRALQYDRNQYDEGYQDAMDSIVRCGECALRRAAFVIADIPGLVCGLTGLPVSVADYCSMGERSEGE